STSTHRVSVFFIESIQYPADLVHRVPEDDVVVPVGVGRLALVFELFAESGVVGRDLLSHAGFVGNLRLEATDLVCKVAVKRLREVELVVAPLADSAKSLILSVESLDLSTEPVGHPFVVGDVVPLVGQSLAELDLEITSSVPEAFVVIL